MLIKFYTTLLMLLPMSLFAQQNSSPCGLASFIETRENDVSSFQANIQSNYQTFVENYSLSIAPKSIRLLPVVVHVLHQGGTENISDAQVQRMIEILNRDFRKQNADTAYIIPEFQPIASDASIEFRLAQIDPNGNFTNGIDRIYSHLTNNADINARINAWDNSKYINIWVFKSFNQGAFGFTSSPYDTITPSCLSGISILHSYVGDIGTGSLSTCRNIVHEMGHFLGLLHPNNSLYPMVVCGDEGLADTPITKGFVFCPSNSDVAKVCDTLIVENYQNIMESSYCMLMFTHDQVNLMNAVLENPNYGRSNLWTPQNLVETGITLSPAPIGKPIAAFTSNSKFTCEGTLVTFTDQSYNAPVTNRTWYFTDGTPTSSTDSNPSVVFTGLGWKEVKLVVSNQNGTDSIEVIQGVHISQDWADITGPYTETFDNSNLISWLIDNPEDTTQQWEYDALHGLNNSGCMRLNSSIGITQAPPCSADYFSWMSVGESIDALISPSFDLTNTTNVNLSFDYAYASHAIDTSILTEKLRVYYSRNCGKTWFLKQLISGSDLITSTITGSNLFYPTENTQWKTVSFPFISNATDTRTRFKFEFTNADSSSTIYLDNFQLSGVLANKENPLEMMNLEIFPNPTHSGSSFTIRYESHEKPMTILLQDVQGKELLKIIHKAPNEHVNLPIKTDSIAPGMYYLSLIEGNFFHTEKLIIQP